MTTAATAPPNSATSAVDIGATVARLRTTFATGRTRDVGWRKRQLEALQKLVTDNEQAIAAALEEDLGRTKLPFGGVGPSGMGADHGRFGFEEFSHRKSVLTKPTRPDSTQMIYPPYTEKAWKLARKVF